MRQAITVSTTMPTGPRRSSQLRRGAASSDSASGARRGLRTGSAGAAVGGFFDGAGRSVRCAVGRAWELSARLTQRRPYGVFSGRVCGLRAVPPPAGPGAPGRLRFPGERGAGRALGQPV